MRIDIRDSRFGDSFNVLNSQISAITNAMQEQARGGEHLEDAISRIVSAFEGIEDVDVEQIIRRITESSVDAASGFNLLEDAAYDLIEELVDAAVYSGMFADYTSVVAFAPISISVEALDALALEEYQKDWMKFRVGDFVNIYREEFGIEYKEMRLVSYEHNPVRKRSVFLCARKLLKTGKARQGKICISKKAVPKMQARERKLKDF